MPKHVESLMKPVFIWCAMAAIPLAPTTASAQDASFRNGDRMAGQTFPSPQGPAFASYVVTKGGTSIATAQVPGVTTATLVAPARAGRQRITLSISAANTCAFGNAAVTTTTGFPLQPVAGATLTLDTAAAIYAACSTATQINVLEQY